MQRCLSRNPDVAESELRRMLNPDHATKAATIDHTLRRLPKRVSITVDGAATVRQLPYLSKRAKALPNSVHAENVNLWTILHI